MRGPQIPDDVTGHELPSDVKRALSTLPSQIFTSVARHLVMTGALLDDDPELALAHAEAARRLAARVGVVREAVGIAAYRAGKYSDAVRELRTARRLTGSEEHLALIADCERALGRPEKALEIAQNPPAGLDPETRVELLIVGSGARLDLGDPAAAVRELEIGELDMAPKTGRPEVRQARARLFSAYADALAAAGREDETAGWLAKAAEADLDGSTGAAERLGIDDPEFYDLGDDEEEVEGTPDDAVGAGESTDTSQGADDSQPAGESDVAERAEPVILAEGDSQPEAAHQRGQDGDPEAPVTRENGPDGPVDVQADDGGDAEVHAEPDEEPAP